MTMTATELIAYRTVLNMNEKEFAALIGVTPQAVRLWETDKRSVPETTVRLINLFKKYPDLVREF